MYIIYYIMYILIYIIYIQYTNYIYNNKYKNIKKSVR